MAGRACQASKKQPLPEREQTLFRSTSAFRVTSVASQMRPSRPRNSHASNTPDRSLGAPARITLARKHRDTAMKLSRPTIGSGSTSRRPRKPAEETLLRAFQHADAVYEVRLQTIEGSQLVSLHLSGTEHHCTLHPLPGELPKGLSPATIESGYIAVAQWLVRTGRWPVPQQTG
jgi:hypothetical protein